MIATTHLGRRLRRCSAAVIAAAALTTAGWSTPASAASPVNDQTCLAEATGLLAMASSPIELGQSVTLQWSAQAPCAVTRHIIGPGFGPGESLSQSGHRTVTPTASGQNTWQLDIVGNQSGKTLALDSRTITVSPPGSDLETTAFQADSGILKTLSPVGVAVPAGPAMMPGTSPSILPIAIDNGRNTGNEIAYQATNGHLWTISPTGVASDTGLGMKAATSPSLTTATSGYEIAFQANSGMLWTLLASGTATNTGLAMAPASSPSATYLSSGAVWIAFQGKDHFLWQLGPDGVGRWAGDGLGVEAKTSPSITWAPQGGFEIAFQAWGEDTLWTLLPDGTPRDTGLPMAPASSPSIATSADGVETVFQRSNHYLWAVGTNDLGFQVSNGLGVETGTSPAYITLPSGGYEIAFQAWGLDTLWIVSSDNVGRDTGLKMAPGTSPATTVKPQIIF